MVPGLPLALLLAALGATPASAAAAPVGAAAAAPRDVGSAAGSVARELSSSGDDAAEDASVCDVGGGGLLLPVLPDENTWNKPARAMLYFVGLSWCFIGVSIVADIFMSAIEAITEKRKTVIELSNGRTVVVKAWNDTVANLSLMALGSSAPEILLSCIEIVGNKFYSGALGPSTIVGSAAFNLLVIIAVCMYAIPNGEKRTIRRPAVFVVTAFASTFAYVWLVIIVGFSSPDVIEPWEGVSTFAFFPILVVVAFLADKGKLSFAAAKQSTKPQLGCSATKSLGELQDHEVKLVEDNALAGRSRAQIRKGLGKIGGEKDLPASDLAVGFTTPDFFFPAGAGELVLEVQKAGLQASKYFVEVGWEDSGGRKGSTTIHKNQTQGIITIRSGSVGGERLSVSLTRAYASYTQFATTEGADTTQSNTRRKTCSIMPEFMKAQVTIADEDSKTCGVGMLRMACGVHHHQPRTDCETQCWVKVCRFEGSQGPVGCRLLTIPDTARPANVDKASAGGGDYQHLDCQVVLESGVMEKSVPITIQKRSEYEGGDRLFVELEGDHVAEGASNGRCAVNILPASEATDTAMRVARWMDHAFNFDVLNEGSANWADQFRSAIWPISDEEHDEVTAAEWCMHFVALPWKLLFAFIPPVAYGGGWVCFSVALVFIGGVTAVIGDLASLMGCCLGLPDAITAITIVALGTSLPDLFASKVSAVEDPSADNAIGNVTGSNAVNVFLGLGLPWMMAAFYWAGNATPEWRAAYPEAPHIYEAFPDGAFVVLAGDIVFSVIVFLLCSMVALMTIRYRRKAHEAELGGPAGIKVNSTILFVLLWFVYISCASWKTLAGDVGGEAMVLAVLCNVAGAGFLMVLIVTSVHVYEGYVKRSEEHSQEAQATLLQNVVQAVREEKSAQGRPNRKTVMDMFRRQPRATAAAEGAAGGSIAEITKAMDFHLRALSSICEDLGRRAAAGAAAGAADAGGGDAGAPPPWAPWAEHTDDEDAEEGLAKPVVAAVEKQVKKKKAKVNLRRSIMTSDAAAISPSFTLEIGARAAPRPDSE